MVCLREQSAVDEECLSEVLTAANPTGSFACLPAHGLQVFTHILSHVRSRQVTPKIFHGIKFRRVRRQVFDRQPVRLPINPLLDLGSAVRWQSVPQQNDSSPTNMFPERLKVRQNLRLLHGPRHKSQAQSDAPGVGRSDQAGDSRQTLPVERRDQDGGLATRRPGASHARLLRESAFVQENQQGFCLPGLFLMDGQRYRNQRRILSSFRSRAFCVVRWQLQPNCLSTFHT